MLLCSQLYLSLCPSVFIIALCFSLFEINHRVVYRVWYIEMSENERDLRLWRIQDENNSENPRARVLILNVKVARFTDIEQRLSERWQCLTNLRPSQGWEADLKRPRLLLCSVHHPVPSLGSSRYGTSKFDGSNSSLERKNVNFAFTIATHHNTSVQYTTEGWKRGSYSKLSFQLKRTR